MVEYKYNPLNNSYISITLGNYTKSFTSTVGKSLQTNLNQIAQQAQSAMNTANGKNAVYSLTYKPAITKSSAEGDLLYLKNGDKTELWILKLVDGKLQWVEEISDATQEELKAQLMLEVGEHLAHRGLRQVERLRGLGNRSREHHRPESFEVTQVHRILLPIAISYGISIESLRYE